LIDEEVDKFQLEAYLLKCILKTRTIPCITFGFIETRGRQAIGAISSFVWRYCQYYIRARIWKEMQVYIFR